MSYSRHTENVPLSILDGSDGELAVTFDWKAGTPPSGLSGPPENYDPGEGDEFAIISAHYANVEMPHAVGLGEHEEERIIEWLDENFERPDDGPDPDFLNDQRREDELLARCERGAD